MQICLNILCFQVKQLSAVVCWSRYLCRQQASVTLSIIDGHPGWKGDVDFD
jgi:hypothetical protein